MPPIGIPSGSSLFFRLLNTIQEAGEEADLLRGLARPGEVVRRDFHFLEHLLVDFIGNLLSGKRKGYVMITVLLGEQAKAVLWQNRDLWDKSL